MKQVKNHQVVVRLGKQTKDKLDKVVVKEGLTPAAWIRRLIMVTLEGIK